MMGTDKFGTFKMYNGFFFVQYISQRVKLF